jgi:cellulose synthase operon protein C
MCRVRWAAGGRFERLRWSVAVGVAGVLALGVGARWAQAQNRPAQKFGPDLSGDADKLLILAASLAQDRQWSEALNIYQRVIDQYGDKLVLLPNDKARADASGDFGLYVDDRQFCHAAIAQLPPEAREIYRNRTDGLAGRWFQQGASRRDLGLLRRVVNQAFCSSWGDDALELLGDLAFQEGRFGEALAMYGRLVADRAGDPLVLVHPDPTVDLARVAAKKMLCRAAAGEKPPGKTDLDEFARVYPGAEGALAGRKGPYAEILAESLAADHLAPPPQLDGRWPTFAGSLSRSKIVASPIDVGSTQWRVELDKVGMTRQTSLMPRGGGMGAGVGSPERLLAYHPIVLGDQVIVSDGTRVLAFNLNDRPADTEGSTPRPVEPAWKHDPENGSQVPQARALPMVIPRHTLTAVGHRIYARMGTMSAGFMNGMGGMAARGSSSIIALDWNTQGKLLWELPATKINLPNRPPDRIGMNRAVVFEGTPVADGRNVYVAVTDRRETTSTYIACLDADTGQSRWIRYLGFASPDGVNMMGMPLQFGGITASSDFNHRLLSLEGPALYYQTNLGAVIALEAETGATLWLATYPRQEANALGSNGSERDLNPAVVDDGRVFVAPSDADAIFAFDATTGRLLWKSEPISDDVKLSHLLGVAKGRLIATGDRVLLFDVKTGELRHAWPDSGKSQGGWGRGLLAGDFIYWPTKNEIEILDQRTALRAQPPIELGKTYHTKGGNLVAGDGYLIVAQEDGIVVFCQNSRLIERYQNEIARAPERAVNYFRVARAAEAIGRDPLALDMYREAVLKARPNETIDGLSLVGAARDHRFRLLLRLAGQARKSKRWNEASGHLDAAAAVTRSDPERLQAQLLRADVFLDAGRPGEAVDICQRLLADEQLRPLAVAADDGHRTIRADLYITDRLKAIMQAHGRGLYESYDGEAARLLSRGRQQNDIHLLDQVGRSFPVARVVPDSLAALGSLYESARRWTDAAHAYKRLLLTAPDDDWRAQAIWRLARVYEMRKLFLSARDSYLELQARYPQVTLNETGGKRTVAELVAAELARPLYAQLIADRPLPPTPVPLLRRWYWPAPAGEPLRVIGASGVAPSLDAGRLFIVENTGLRLLDPATGLPRWSADLGAPAVWAGYLADKLIAATPRQIVALELGQGSVQWRYDLARSGKSTERPDPFADAKEDGDAPPRHDSPNEVLSAFQLVKGHVYCLRGPGELIAIDGDTGAVDWSFSSPSGPINPHFLVGADRTILQVETPNQLLVLRTEDGRPTSRTALDENERLQRVPMPVDEDSVLLVTDLRTVKKFDLTHGQTVWVYQESRVLPVNGAPRVFGDSERLLVLHDGRTLIRLDAATGSKRWTCSLGSQDLSERPGAMVYDDRRFFFVNTDAIYGGPRQVVRAVSLEDGSGIWTRVLASDRDDVTWSIALTRRYVIAYPANNPPSTDHVEKLPATVIPMIVRRRETGELVQRFVFPTRIADLTVKADPNGGLVATTMGFWGLGSKEASSAPVSDRGH